MSLGGCLSPHTERAADTDPRGWRAGDTVSVRISNGDTTGKRAIALFIRYDDRFLGGEVPLHIKVTAPDSTHISEPFTMRVSRPAGSFSGHEEIAVGYRTNSVLSQRGEYTFGFTPAANAIEGISAIGVRISEQ